MTTKKTTPRKTTAVKKSVGLRIKTLAVKPGLSALTAESARDKLKALIDSLPDKELKGFRTGSITIVM